MAEPRSVFVTGGANAVGRALALDLAAHGMQVYVVDIDDEHGHSCVDEISRAGGVATYRHVDVRDETQVAAALDDMVDRYGRIDGAPAPRPRCRSSTPTSPPSGRCSSRTS